MSGSSSLQSTSVCMFHMECLMHQWDVLALTTLVLDAPDTGGTFFQVHFSASVASALVFFSFDIFRLTVQLIRRFCSSDHQTQPVKQ